MSEIERLDESQHVALVDLVNRLMDQGVVVSGELVISVADVDLLYLNLNLLLSSVETVLAFSASERAPGARPEAGG
jgi:gas vesicle structural protein